MALIVEDGTGLADAESYLSVVGFKAYCDGRGLSYVGNSDPVIEQKLRIATGYIDTVRRYKGNRVSASQALEFPRSSLADWGGLIVTGLPSRVKSACAELALVALTESLYANQDRGGKVKSQSVGPISVTYADDAPAGKTFTAAMRLLDPFVRDNADAGAPYFVAQEPHFTLTTDDHPGVDEALS